MAEYIEREALLEKAQNERIRLGYDIVSVRDIESMPAEDVSPVRHGRWLHTEEPLGWKDVDCMECSACHDSWIIEEDYCFDDMPLWNYCPSCGAKMDGGVGDACL